jgi:AAA domain/Bifunctional DNA primase/polymerase, N-terminal
MTPLDTALSLADDGMYVFPVKVFPDPARPGYFKKVPMCPNGHLDATLTPDLLDWSGATHVGIACEPSKIWVVDVDAVSALAEFPQRATRFQQTVRGGYHYIYRADQKIDQRNTTGAPVQGIDIRANGGFIVWYGIGECIEDTILAWPFGLIEKEGKAGGYLPARTRAGGRNNDSICYAGALMAQNPGMTIDFVIDALKGHTTAWHDPPLSDDEVMRLANNSVRFRSVRDQQRASGAGLQRYQDIMLLPPVSWLVKGLFIRGGINALYGPSGAGKSFFTIDVGIAIAEGRQWHGRRTKACPVVYVVLEGQAGIQQRLNAWAKRNGRVPPDNFMVYMPRRFSLLNPEDTETLLGMTRKAGLVEPVFILDTLSRATPGVDENAAEGMGNALAALERLRGDASGSILLVHHTGKDKRMGLRGHSSLKAALDGAVFIDQADDGSRSWACDKVKDGPDDAMATFSLEVMETDILDEDGDVVTSCVILYGEDGVKDRGPSSSAIDRRLNPTYEIVVSLMREQKLLAADLPLHHTTMEDAVDRVCLALNRRKDSALRGIRALIDYGHLAESDGRLFDPK